MINHSSFVAKVSCFEIVCFFSALTTTICTSWSVKYPCLPCLLTAIGSFFLDDFFLFCNVNAKRLEWRYSRATHGTYFWEGRIKVEPLRTCMGCSVSRGDGQVQVLYYHCFLNFYFYHSFFNIRFIQLWFWMTQWCFVMIIKWNQGP